MTTKLIPAQIVKDTCYNCPYCLYDRDYGRSYDSGYDCDFDGSPEDRIADDYKIDQYRKQMGEYTKSLDTLFPLDEPENPMKIPSWCGLEDVK